MMSWERIAWWVFWFSFGFIIAMLFFGFSVAFLTATSVEIAYLLGLFSFLLLGNRLLFGYGWLANLLDAVISIDNVLDEYKERLEQRLSQKNIQPVESIKDLTFKSLIILALKDLDYYRYSYYGLFLLLTIFTLLAKFNLLGDIIVGKYIEGVFWGAATATFFVWLLEQLSKVSFIEYNLKSLKENTKEE